MFQLNWHKLLAPFLLLVSCFFVYAFLYAKEMDEVVKSNVPPRPPTQDELEAFMKKVNPEGIELNNIIKANFKIVWCRDFSKSSSLKIPNKTLRLMKFVKDNFPAEEVLLADYADYYLPMFTADGEKIVFSKYTPKVESYMVNFDGSGLRRIADGLAIGLVLDDKNKQEWLYTAKLEKASFNIIRAIYRQPLGSTNKQELVWDKIPATYSSISFSTSIAMTLPLNVCGYVDLKNESFTRVAEYGDFPSFLPNNPNIFCFLERFSRNFAFFDISTQRKWKVSFDKIKSIGVYGVSQIRWSNRYPFFVFTAPYLVDDRTGILEMLPDKLPRVYVGEISSDGTQVIKAIPITLGRFPDFFPSIWIDTSSVTNR